MWRLPRCGDFRAGRTGSLLESVHVLHVDERVPEGPGRREGVREDQAGLGQGLLAQGHGGVSTGDWQSVQTVLGQL